MAARWAKKLQNSEPLSIGTNIRSYMNQEPLVHWRFVIQNASTMNGHA